MNSIFTFFTLLGLNWLSCKLIFIPSHLFSSFHIELPLSTAQYSNSKPRPIACLQTAVFLQLRTNQIFVPQWAIFPPFHSPHQYWDLKRMNLSSTRLDTFSKTEPINISATIPASLLQDKAENNYCQEVLDIIGSSNSDDRLFSSQISDIVSSIVYGKYCYN